jgi:flagellar hook-associated protein 3 FlgL
MQMSSTLRDLSGAYNRLVKSQTQMTTGKVLSQASDDPNVAMRSMNLRATLARFDSFDRSVQDAKGWLGTADSALMSASDTLVRAKEIVVRASNSGGLSDPGARQALATEMRSIRDEMLSVANTSYNGRSVFAGTAAGQAYSAAGVFQGNTGSVVRDVDQNTSVTVNVTGVQAFGDPASASGDVFAVLDRLATAIAAGDDTALAAGHSQLDAATQQLNNATVEIGARGKQMDIREQRNAAERERITSLLSNTEDIDLASVMVDVKARENAYNAALQVAGSVLPKSLVDYLR